MPMGSWGCPYLPSDGIKPSADQENLVADRGDKRVRRHRGPIAMSSYYNYECICVYFFALRGHCEGFTKSCYLRKTIGSFVCPSYGLREAKVPMAPMITRSKHEDDTTRQDGLTMASRCLTKGKIDTRSQHENEPSWGVRQILWLSKIWKRSRSCSRCLKNSTSHRTMIYDSVRCPYEWPDFYTITPEVGKFPIFTYSCIHRESTSG